MGRVLCSSFKLLYEKEAAPAPILLAAVFFGLSINCSANILLLLIRQRKSYKSDKANYNSKNTLNLFFAKSIFSKTRN